MVVHESMGVLLWLVMIFDIVSNALASCSTLSVTRKDTLTN